MVYPSTDGQSVTHPSTNPAVHGRESNSQPVDHKSDALTTTPPRCIQCVERFTSASIMILSLYKLSTVLGSDR